MQGLRKDHTGTSWLLLLTGTQKSMLHQQQHPLFPRKRQTEKVSYKNELFKKKKLFPIFLHLQYVIQAHGTDKTFTYTRLYLNVYSYVDFKEHLWRFRIKTIPDYADLDLLYPYK